MADNKSGMVLFASDLDDTLFHSHWQERPGDIVVEVLRGRAQTLMSKDAVPLLGELQRHVLFVPVTSRSLAQYRRIVWPRGIVPPRIAIVSNGGNLLVEGEVSAEWKRESLEIVRPYSAQTAQAFRSLMGTCLATSGRVVDGFFAVAAFQDSETAERVYGEIVFPAGLWHVRSGRKIFAGPPGIDKQTAVLRLEERYGSIASFIAAGDSAMDLGMLRTADLALMPKPMQAACADQQAFNRSRGQEDFGCALLEEALLWCLKRTRQRRCVLL